MNDIGGTGEGPLHKADGSGFKLQPVSEPDTAGDDDKPGDLGHVKTVGYVAGRVVPESRR